MHMLSTRNPLLVALGSAVDGTETPECSEARNFFSLQGVENYNLKNLTLAGVE